MSTGRRLRIGVLTMILFLGLCPAALADTGPDTPRLTQQPDQLVLQLGARWAGVEFELRTDAGIFPVPVIVDASGVLTMDLGGSTTYTLSCIKSTVPIPDPAADGAPEPSAPESQPTDPEPGGGTEAPTVGPRGIPTAQLVVFVAGLLLAIGGLVALYLTKRRQAAQYDWDDEEEEQ